MPSRRVERDQFDRLRDAGLFQGDLKAGLETLRRKLLDLSTRNKLIAHKHPKRSSLRIVDELTDFVFSNLLDGGSLSFKAIEKPSKDERQRLSRPSEANQELTAIEVARFRGVNTAYDLPVPRPGGPAAQLPAHRDNYLQTLLYPEDLNATVETLFRAARVSIEERGINILYLAFGFLEWTEREDSEQRNAAPLLLLPVTLERGGIDRATGFRRFQLAYSGEDVGDNLSLREKLRELSLVLPSPLDEAEGERFVEPDQYFRSIQPILNTKQDWKIRRWMTLGCFEFSKLLMYRDLDPDAWPKERSLSEHKLVRPFFESTDAVHLTPGEIYPDLDAPAKIEKFPLIFEADSSQHSVVVDALEGKSLVVQGPPGTGKSQSITNLIGAALGGGKTVLFVSEKLAALEVVRRRLSKAGLGDFSLELHSNKAHKRALLDDIAQRLRARHRFPSPRKLATKLEGFEKQRRTLADYSHFISQPFGATGSSAKDIVTAAVNFRQRASLPQGMVEQCKVERPEAVTEATIEERAGQFTSFAKALRQALPADSKWAEHPLFGLDNYELQFSELNAVLLGRQQVLDALRAVRHEIAVLSEISGCEIPLTLGRWRQCALEGARWPSKSKPLPLYFPHLADAGVRGQLRRFAIDLTHYRSSVDELSKLLDAHGVLADTRKLSTKDVFLDASRLGLGASTRQTTSAVGAACARIAELSANCMDDLPKICRAIGIPLANGIRGIRTLLIMQALARETPWEQLKLRSESMKRPSFAAALEEFERELEAIASERQRLSESFILSALPEKQQLAEHLLVVRSVGALRLFDRRWRQSKRLLVGLSRTVVARAPREWVPHLETLISYQERHQEFESNATYRDFFGSAFRGANSDVAGIRRLLDWQARVRAQLEGARTADGAVLADIILTSNEERLADLANATDTHSVEFSRFNELLALFDSVEISEQRKQFEIDPELERLAESAGRVAQCVERLVSAWDSLSARPNCSVDGLCQALELAQQTAAFGEYLAGSSVAAEYLGGEFRGLETDPGEILSACDAAESLLALDIPHQCRDAVFKSHAPETFKSVGESLTRLNANISRLQERISGLRALLAPNAGKWPRISVDEADAATVERFFSALPDAASELDDAVDLVRRGKSLAEAGFEPIIHSVFAGTLPCEKMDDALRCVLYHHIAEAIFRKNPQFAKFRGMDHEAAQSRFVELDEEILELQRQLIANRLDSRPVPAGMAGGRAAELTELALLMREIGKQKRHIPIRQLIRRSWRALVGLKPCFMMSPLSVAQYLPPGEIEFDLVVMDEASQIRPEEALGAIARGRQVVIVGDSNQLPPTSFFERTHLDDPEAEDVANIAEESESILEAASSVLPQRSLIWHYRSQHESLIAFSNRHIYNDELVVLPSARGDHPDFGIKWRFVPEGSFQGSRNRSEAEQVVAAALVHMESGRTESLGVVAMNSDQAELIESLVEARVAKSSVAEQWLAQRNRGSEPFFVKNLENVQGDERDVILISFTYGRGASAPPEQNFGPINRAYGWRRLNVLYTRARKRILAFASMRHDMISNSGRNPRALNALRDYLRFAESGGLHSISETGRSPESPFEEAVIRLLSQRGYSCVPQVGAANYRIDVAVRNPDRPGEFLVGIECDGAPYHSGKSVRDRDRIRQSILESLGWRICRIWSADWYRDTDRQLGRVESFITEALRESRSRIDERQETRREQAESPDTAAKIGATDGREASQKRGQPPVQQSLRIGLSVDEARDELIQLREKEIKSAFPDADPSNGLLRAAMLEKLLSLRPRNKQEFLAKMPLFLRESTDSKQVATYLDRVIDILNEIRD